MRNSKISLLGFFTGISLFSICGFIICIFISGLWPWPAMAEKYKNATGEIVEMPKGMKPPPKQAWDTTPMKLPTTSGGKSTPTTTTQKQPAPAQKPPSTPVQKTSTTTTKKQPVTVQKPSPTPVQKTTTTTTQKQPAPVQKPSSIPTTATKSTPPGIKPLTPPGQQMPTTATKAMPSPAATPTSPGMVQNYGGQGQPPLSGIVPPSSPERLTSTPKSGTLAKDSLTSPGSTSLTEETMGENESASGSEDTSDEGVLPPWMPAAAGAAAGGAAAVGSLLTMAASGVRPREVWDGAKDLLTQRPSAGTDDQDAADKEALQELKEQRMREKEETQRINEEEAKRDKQEAYERAHVDQRVRYLMEGDILKEKQRKNIMESEILNARAKEAMNYSFTKTLFTCRYPDGSFSLPVAGIHMAASVLSAELLPALTYTKGFLTLTPSTYIFSVGSASYMYDDYRAAGYTPVSAATRAVGWTAGAELIGSAGGHYFGKLITPGIRAVGTEVSEFLGSSVSKAGTEMSEVAEAAANSAGKGKLSEVASSTPKLSPTQYEMRTAAATMKTLTNGTVEEQKIAAKDMLRLSQDVKAELEKTGKINPAQVKTITDTQTRITENALDEATPKAIKEFTEKTGVKLEKATVANQSSARAWSQRSLETTDEDRTVFLKFDKESYDNYVKNEFKGDEAAAQKALNNTYKETHDEKMTAALAKQGLKREDVKYGTYVGTGGTKGEVNLPATRTEVAHQTSPTPAKEFEVNPETGKIGPPKKISQQRIFDERAMEEYKKSGTPPPETGTKITVKDAEQQVELYKKKLSKGDMGPYDAAKGYQRYCKGLAILKKPYDTDLLQQCLKVTNHPTEAMKDLGTQGQEKLIEKISRAVH